MPQFILKITLGNEVMQTGGDIARAIRAMSFDIDWRGFVIHTVPYHVKDINGNTVGSWQVK
jgi:hypothetical protein